ncbi:MAG: hypothetical protein RIB61_11770 [Roseicyclus sp.]
MHASDITTYARALYTAHGDRAEYEAQQRRLQAEQDGATDRAESWRKIRLTIREMRGASAS